MSWGGSWIGHLDCGMGIVRHLVFWARSEERKVGRGFFFFFKKK